MSNDLEREIAELILAEAHSGSATWDELNGPSAVMRRENGEWIIELPGWCDETDSYDFTRVVEVRIRTKLQ